MAVKAREGEQKAETQDISAGGVLFRLDEEMAVGTQLEFDITFPPEMLGGEKQVLVRCLGRVVRCSPEGDRRTVAAVIDEYQFVC